MINLENRAVAMALRRAGCRGRLVLSAMAMRRAACVRPAARLACVLRAAPAYGDGGAVAGEVAVGTGVGLGLVGGGVLVRDGLAVGAWLGAGVWLAEGAGELLARLARGVETVGRAGAGRSVFWWAGSLALRACAGAGAAGVGRTSR